MTGGFHSQRASNAESGSMSWRLYDLLIYFDELTSSTGITIYIHLFVHSSLAMICLLWLVKDIIKAVSTKSPNFSNLIIVNSHLFRNNIICLFIMKKKKY